MALLYKILSRSRWEQADQQGRVPPTPTDERDGFVHLSAASQIEATAQRYYADAVDLVLLGIDPARLSKGTLRWEIARGDEAFPHVYGDIPLEAVVAVHGLVDRQPGRFSFPEPL